jgi:hypothetical protein
MKKLIAVVIVLSLAIALITTASAQTGNQVLLKPTIVPHEITVTSEDELILHTGWGACTYGLVKAWINASNYYWYLDDESILPAEDVNNYWGPITGPIEPEGPSTCIAGPGTGWVSYWTYSIGSLPVGTYEVKLTIDTDHKFLDGGDYDGDGKIDFFVDGWNASVIVHVVEP